MSDEDKTPAVEKKVFDVAKPSTTPAEANSKHIIVNHGPMMHDNTLVGQGNGSDMEEVKDSSQESHLSASTHALEIKPLSDDLETSTPDKDKPESSSAKTAEQDPAPPATEDASPKHQSSDVAAESSPSTQDSQKTTDDDDSKSKDKSSNEQAEAEKAAKAEAERDARISGYVESGQYFLSINKVGERKNRQLVIVGIVVAVLLAVVWLDVALDAGIISNTYHLPHTNFFALKS